eukprot:1158385-Pelagomonas_calceolata.AAC.9
MTCQPRHLWARQAPGMLLDLWKLTYVHDGALAVGRAATICQMSSGRTAREEPIWGPGAAPVGVAMPSKREFSPLHCEPPSIRCPCLCGGDGRAAPSAACGSPGAGAYAG